MEGFAQKNRRTNSKRTLDCFQETFLTALELSRRQEVRNLQGLLVRLAGRTEDELSRTRQQVVQLFANYQPGGFEADPRPFQSFPERNEP